jgi:hypothetical protein
VLRKPLMARVRRLYLLASIAGSRAGHVEGSDLLPALTGIDAD